MLPLHSGHSGTESLVILALAVVVVGVSFALSREGWSRVGALLGVAVAVGAGRLGVAVVGIHGDATHLLGHALELSGLVVVLLAGYYTLFAARAATPTEN